MEIESITVKKFRNYQDEVIHFHKGLNILLGDNAQGKTNIAEAIMLCCIGRSPRTLKDREMITFESNAGYIKAEALRKIGKSRVEIYITKKDKKRIQVNGIPILKMGELMGTINAVFFSPDELSLIKEAPDERRKFLDTDISQMKKSYFYALKRYHKALTERNNLLKKYSMESVEKTVEIWNEQLAKEGARIIAERSEFCKNLLPFARSAHAFLTDEKENLSLEYATLKCQSEDVEATRQSMRIELDKSLEKDYKLGYTTVGPHRDDIKITVNDVDVRNYGSQGQQRTAALSMKLAELNLFYEEIGEYPVLILDDVLSELDPERQKKLMEFSEKVQTVLTATNLSEKIMKGRKCHIIRIESGRVTSESNRTI